MLWWPLAFHPVAPPGPAFVPPRLIQQRVVGCCRVGGAQANHEPKQRQRLIFKVIRCLHCHQGARAGHIPKTTRTMKVYAFQMKWLTSVQSTSLLASPGPAKSKLRQQTMGGGQVDSVCLAARTTHRPCVWLS